MIVFLVNLKSIKSLTIITYTACGSFTKHRERIEKFRETGNLKHLYRNEAFLDKACFAHDAAYSDSKDLAKRTISNKIWKIELLKLLEIVTVMNIKEH